MNQYITGKTIKQLRKRANMTQAELAQVLSVSDKTISKWETGKGYPDITSLAALSKALKVSTLELLSGEAVFNNNISSNMLNTKFYVCPICGNVIQAIGEVSLSCHGVSLPYLQANDDSLMKVEKVENEIFISIDHKMTKDDYISFAAAVSSDRIQLVKFYPESNAEARFNPNGVRYIYYFSNREGLFRKAIKRV